MLSRSILVNFRGICYTFSMHLRGKEVIQGVYRRHYFPFVVSTVKILAASFPFYFLLFVAEESMARNVFYAMFGAITALFVFVFCYVSFVYWADKLVVTNFRVIYIDWKLVNVSEEMEAEIEVIQDIHVIGKGIFSFIPFLNYGTLAIATSSSKVSIHFENAPNPHEIKRFIFSFK